MRLLYFRNRHPDVTEALMSDALERMAGEATPVTLESIARQQRYVILALMVVSLLLGVLLGAVLTRGAFADPDNRISISGQAMTADSLSSAFANAAAVVEPAVVHIDVREGAGREAKGSGVLVTSTGYVLTNYHVVEGATKIGVRLSDHREFDGKVVGSDEDTDLAVVKIEAGTELPFARFGDSDHLRVGDWVLAVGSPFGLEQTVTAGIVGAKDRETDGGATAFQQFLQTDAAINPGNSRRPAREPRRRGGRDQYPDRHANWRLQRNRLRASVVHCDGYLQHARHAGKDQPRIPRRRSGRGDGGGRSAEPTRRDRGRTREVDDGQRPCGVGRSAPRRRHHGDQRRDESRIAAI